MTETFQAELSLRLVDEEDLLHSAGKEWGFSPTGERYVFDWDTEPAYWVRDTDDAGYVAARKAAILRRRDGRRSE